MRITGLLGKVTALIADACDPDAIVLFGSFAKGRDNADSDVDLLVIGEFGGARFLRDREVRQLLYRFPVHFDVHFATRAEITAERGRPFGFLRSVLSSGVVLYEKDAGRPIPRLEATGACDIIGHS